MGALYLLKELLEMKESGLKELDLGVRMHICKYKRTLDKTEYDRRTLDKA